MAAMRTLLVLFLAVQAFAGTAYDVRKHHDGKTEALTVLVEGERHRADLATGEDDAVLFTSVLWTGGENAIALNARNGTWYERTADPLAPRSNYLNPLYQPTVKNLRWTMSEANGTYSARLSYDVHGTVGGGVRIRVRCSAEYVIETSEAHPRALWLGRVFASTHVPEVDAQLAAADPSIARFPTRITLTATRQYDGGPAMHDVVTVEVRDVRAAKVAPQTFVRPADSIHQKPVMAGPGR
jgi:hypothetical protein